TAEIARARKAPLCDPGRRSPPPACRRSRNTRTARRQSSRRGPPQQDLDPPVLRRFRITPHPKVAIGISFHTLETFLVHASAHQHVIGHVCARCRKPPVVVRAGSIRPPISMAANDQRLR